MNTNNNQTSHKVSEGWNLIRVYSCAFVVTRFFQTS
jgi:hypothetical protein